MFKRGDLKTLRYDLIPSTVYSAAAVSRLIRIVTAFLLIFFNFAVKPLPAEEITSTEDLSQLGPVNSFV